MTTPSTLATRLTTPSDREVVMTRVFDAPRRLVFEACTNAKHLPHWLLGPDGWSMPVCDLDLRPGGHWHFVWRKADGTQMEMNGVYTTIRPPEKLVNTENWGGDWPETTNTFHFAEEDGQTTVTLTIVYPSKQARDAAIKTGMQEGADASFERLTRYLKTM